MSLWQAASKNGSKDKNVNLFLVKFSSRVSLELGAFCMFDS